MVFDFEFQEFANHTLDLVNAWIAEFDHLTALDTDNMVVLFVSVRLLKLGHVFAELVFGHQIAGNQQFQCIVYRGPAYPVFFVFHVDIKGFHIEMVVSGIYLFKNSIALRGFAQAFIFQVRFENFLYRLVVFRLSHRPNVIYTNLRNISLIYKRSGVASVVRIKAGNTRDSLDLPKVLDEVFQVRGVVDENHDGPLKNNFITGDGDGTYIDLKIV